MCTHGRNEGHGRRAPRTRSGKRDGFFRPRDVDFLVVDGSSGSAGAPAWGSGENCGAASAVPSRAFFTNVGPRKEARMVVVGLSGVYKLSVAMMFHC